MQSYLSKILTHQHISQQEALYLKPLTSEFYLIPFLGHLRHFYRPNAAQVRLNKYVVKERMTKY